MVDTAIRRRSGSHGFEGHDPVSNSQPWNPGRSLNKRLTGIMWAIRTAVRDGQSLAFLFGLMLIITQAVQPQTKDQAGMTVCVLRYVLAQKPQPIHTVAI